MLNKDLPENEEQTKMLAQIKKAASSTLLSRFTSLSGYMTPNEQYFKRTAEAELHRRLKKYDRIKNKVIIA